ncbi:hypothetical protein CYMTET_56105 [Cymbomonas tetramitiformis]|uniref:Uncharacterized protein n=1 Tax=Cymbomonas tetramitiformis TaxID=36881 RepID=A0AAE0BCU6_9CHLO|nr:hypothetical protein CYMTET_56105 [Cymbomonas tetramitiformis]|eukprot:gene1569-2203_t
MSSSEDATRLPEVVLKSYPNGPQLLSKYRKNVEVSPQSQQNASAFDKSTWHGVNPALDKWHEIVQDAVVSKAKTEKSAASITEEQAVLESRLSEIIHDKIVIHPPTYWETRRGQFMGVWILRNALDIFGTTFTYHRQFADTAGLNIVLEFSCLIDGIPAQGVDIVTFDSNSSDAKMVDLKIMLRPPEAACRMKQLMEVRIEKMMKDMGMEVKDVIKAKL